MKIDLRKDRKSLLKYLKTRVREYPIYINAGPGADEDDITQITLGYQFDQDGWAALVFDTRENAAVDGVWQNYLEETAVELPHWYEASEELASGQSVHIVNSSGEASTIDDGNSLADLFGEFLRDLLVSCRDDGLFDSLPCHDHCRFTVEEHESQYGWTQSGEEDEQDDLNQQDGGDPFAVTDALRRETAKRSKPQQVAFWINRLQQIANDTQRDPEDFDFDVDANVNELAALGPKAVEPMLQLAIQLAGKPQYAGDGDQAWELYRSWVLNQLISKIEEAECSTPKIEKQLRKLVAESLRVNANRELWGAAAFFAAQALFNLFTDKYPCPQLGDHNELLDPEPFVDPPKKNR